MGELATAVGQEIVIEIGGMPVLVRTESAEFLHMLEGRYAGFVEPGRESRLRVRCRAGAAGKDH